MTQQHLKKSHQKESKSPSIYRHNTEWAQLVTKVFLEQSFWWLSVITLILLSAIVWVGFDFRNNYREKAQLEAKRVHIEKQVEYWQGVVKRYPDYRDGYFTLALLEYQLKNYEKVNAYLSKVFAIDPNFEPGRELQDKIPK